MDWIRPLKANNPDGGIVYAYRVTDPERYGVVNFDKEGSTFYRRKPENQIKLRSSWRYL